jgi:hypothetical protein
VTRLPHARWSPVPLLITTAVVLLVIGAGWWVGR